MLDTRPTPAEVGAFASVILDGIKASPEFERLTSSTRKYPDCWATFTGYPLISQWDLDKDAGPLFIEAMRVLALKSAVFGLTDGDEELAELVVSAPVDEMVHAVLAQYTLCQRMTARLGIQFVHMTDTERFGWHPGDYTDQCYQAAGWGEPNPRYWIEAEETKRRLRVLDERYSLIGVKDHGRRHDFIFNADRDLTTVG